MNVNLACCFLDLFTAVFGFPPGFPAQELLIQVSERPPGFARGDLGRQPQLQGRVDWPQARAGLRIGPAVMCCGVLGVDSPPTILFIPKTGRFPWVSGGLLERRIPAKNGRVSVCYICGCVLGPTSSALLSFFWGEGSPAKVDYRKKGYPYSNLSTGGPSIGLHVGSLVVF